MKSKILNFIIILLAVSVMAFSLLGCSGISRAQTAEELIPSAEEMGEAEGLWLYKGEYRSRTDGTGCERLFERINIGGKEFDSEQFDVVDHVYMTDKHRAVFVLSVDDYGNCIYLYDYKNKSGEYLCDVPQGDVDFSMSDGYFYVRMDDVGFLFDSDMNLLCDSLAGTLKNGVLYSVTYSNVTKFEWYCDGVHSVELSFGNSSWEIEICGDYFYFIRYDEPQYAVNMRTDEVTEFTVFEVTYDTGKYKDSYRHVQDRFYYDGKMYVFSVVYCIIDYGDEDDAGKDEWYWFFHKIDGNKDTLEYSFGEVRRGMNVGEYKGKFYFEARTLGNLYQTHYRYDPETGKTKWIPWISYRRGGIPHEFSGSSERSVLKVGDYEFFVSSRMYGYSGFLTAPLGYCYYLNRRYDGNTEIMQYSFYDGNFFDDICEF